MKKQIENTRYYGIDLFKIVLAFMVLILHINAGGTGQVLKYAVEKPLSYLINIVTLLCYPAVNCYMLITGFFIYKSHRNICNTLKSLINIWFSLCFFSVIGYFIVLYFKSYNFYFLEFIKRFLPLTRQTWWFFNIYFSIICISPFLNKFIDNISQKEYQSLLMILLTISSIQPYFVDWKDKLGVNYGNSLIWLTIMYLTGAYIQKYQNLKITESSFKYFIQFIIITLTTFLLSYVLSKYGIPTQLATYNSLLIYIQSIFLFKAFLFIQPPIKCFCHINKIAKLSLASYLLHCQEDIIKVLWKDIQIYDFSNSYQIIPISLVFCVLLYLISIVLEDILNHLKIFLRINERLEKELDFYSRKFGFKSSA